MVINEGLSADPDAVLKMSAMCLNGIAKALDIIAQNEFYFSEFPRSMSCIALTLRGLWYVSWRLVSNFHNIFC